MDIFCSNKSNQSYDISQQWGGDGIPGGWHTIFVHFLLNLHKGYYEMLVGSDLKSYLETLLGYDIFFVFNGGGRSLPQSNKIQSNSRHVPLASGSSYHLIARAGTGSHVTVSQ